MATSTIGTLALALVVSTAGGQDFDPRLKPADELSPRSNVFRQSVAEIRATDAAGEALPPAMGVFIDASTVVVRWDDLEEAHEIEVAPICSGLKRLADSEPSFEALFEYARNLWILGNERVAIETLARAAEIAEPGDQRVLAISGAVTWRVTVERHADALEIARVYSESDQKLADELLPYTQKHIARARGDISDLLGGDAAPADR